MADLKFGKPLKAHNALGVISKDARIRAWLAENDPKALEQVEAALKASEDPNELLRDAIFAQHEDAHGMHNGTSEDRRWGLELVVANLIDACWQAGFDFEAIVKGAYSVNVEREHDGHVAPNWHVTPAEASS